MSEITQVEDPPVAVNVTRRVKPGRIGEFEEWVSGITDAISRFPGFLGCEVLKPGGPSETEYHIIFKFERMSDLECWEDSAASSGAIAIPRANAASHAARTTRHQLQAATEPLQHRPGRQQLDPSGGQLYGQGQPVQPRAGS